ncbi:MAG TPA: ATP-binding protein [Usitatibacter sp.]|nr:ATP-binding protein [Usitatibacter sp.]
MRISMRRHLFALVAAGTLPLAILAAAGLFLLFEQQRDDAQRRTLEITRAIATAVDGELEHSRSAMQVLAASSPLVRGDLAEFREAAVRTLAAQPRWYNVVLADTNGLQLMNAAVPFEQPPAPLRERESFDAVMRTGRAQVSHLIDGRNGLAIALRVPVVQEGRIRYVLSAILKPESIASIVSRQRADPESVISVFDSAGLRVARSRDQDKYIGTRGSPSLRELLARGEPEGMGDSTTLEGGVVFTSYTRLPDSGWTVVMGTPAAAIEGPARRSVAILGAAVAFSLGLGLLAAGLVARRINDSMGQLRRAAAAVGRGEAPEPADTPIVETQEVAVALATAAEQRRSVEAQREALLRSEREARGEAEAANRAKDQFLAMLGHELRNPLAALANAAAVLREQRAAPAMLARSREVIERQVAHLSRLTDDILDAARALLGKIELRRHPLDLAQVVGAAVHTLESTGRAAAHKLTVSLEPVWVDGDEVRLEQVVQNLVVNALKYTPRGGHIRVSLVREDGHAVLRVADNGVGLSRELAARAFDLFVQGERDLDRSQGGLGIGLTLVRRLAELHGGSATVASDGPGRGSEFTVRLPAIERPATPLPEDRPLGASLPRVVLVVEDNDDARDTLKSLLEILGHRVETARDGLSGLEMALAIVPDIALVDVGLPLMDGLEVARRARASLGDRVMLVALTGYGSAEDRARALAAGFHDHITKPVDVALLEAVLARASARHAAAASQAAGS